MKPYCYAATVLQVIDGDTFDAQLDLGFGVFTTKRIQLRGYSAPQRSQPGHDLAATYLRNCLQGNSLVVHTVQRDAFDQWSGWAYVDGQDASVLMYQFLQDLIIGF